MKAEHRKFVIPAAIFIAAGLLWLFYYLAVGRWHVTTDDAYVGGNLMRLTMQTQGRCQKVLADVPQRVVQGQTLVAVDPADAKLHFERAHQQLAQSCQEVAHMYREVDLATAELHAAEAELLKARLDFSNREPLIRIDAITLEDFQHATVALQVANAHLQAARERLKAAQALVYGAEPRNHPKVVTAAEGLREAYLGMLRVHLICPESGIVAQRSVQVGEFISPSRTVMMVLPLKQIWVDANFRETQLRDLHIGQPVELHSDLYGRSVKYRGHVAGIAPASGAVLSILPPQNATGNWIKIVQRFPVRIVLEPEELTEYPLYTGASMEVKVITRDRSGPRVQESPVCDIVSETDIYPEDLSPVNLMIDDTISQYLSVGTCAF